MGPVDFKIAKDLFVQTVLGRKFKKKLWRIKAITIEIISFFNK